MTLLYFLGAIIIGYLLGSIPFGRFYVKLLKGKDIETIGSGRTGGTNSMRAGGWRIGVITAFSDVIKGMMALFLTRWVMTQLGVGVELLPWLEAATGTATVFGHNWSIFYKFRGGAGTGPNIGWSAVIWAPIFPVAVVVMVGMIFLVGWASLGSFAMAVIVPICFGWLYFSGADVLAAHPAYFVGGLLTLAFVTYSLRPNFERLWRGEERVVGLRAYWLKQQAGE